MITLDFSQGEYNWYNIDNPMAGDSTHTVIGAFIPATKVNMDHPFVIAGTSKSVMLGT